jgi:hypothetical protein
VLHQGTVAAFSCKVTITSARQVYTLEKVLRLRKDHVTQVVFLDEAMKVLATVPRICAGSPSMTFAGTRREADADVLARARERS